jgi:signal transduction histidine kinase/CheY-like chemotaxis protein
VNPVRRIRLGRWRVLVLIGLSLAVVLATVAWLQGRILQLAEESVASRTDNLTYGLGQLQADYLRLSDLLHREQLVPGSVPRDQLVLRYEIFVSRVRQSGTEGSDFFARMGQTANPVRLQLEHFVMEADPWLAETASGVPDAATLTHLATDADQLANGLGDLVRAAYHSDAELLTLSTEAVERQSRYAVGLTAFLSLLTLGFAGVLVRLLMLSERREHELEQLTAELGQARAVAEAAAQGRSSFIANLSHELRTPFHGLLGMLTLIGLGPLEHEQKRHLRTARRSGEHLLSILNEVLDASKIDAGGADVSPKELDLRRLLDEVLSLMRPQARERGLALRVSLGEDVPRRLVLDGKRVRQILFNLIGNGLKFTREGEVRLALQWQALAPGDPGRGRLVIDVIDTGLGMDEATLGRLFQRFEQGDASIERRFGGTGLGLEISRTLARGMGGDITVRSAPGRGSCFTLSLPCEIGFAPTEPQDDVGQSARGSELMGLSGAASATMPLQPTDVTGAAPAVTATPAAGLNGLRVLVCDDNEVNRLLLQAFLGHLGCEPLLCDDGAQAVALTRCNAFDLIFMDMHMPGLDGVTATRQIRARAGVDAPAVIVAVTADALTNGRVNGDDPGLFDEVLPKPLDLEELEACLRRHFPHLFPQPVPQRLLPETAPLRP